MSTALAASLRRGQLFFEESLQQAALLAESLVEQNGEVQQNRGLPKTLTLLSLKFPSSQTTARQEHLPTQAAVLRNCRLKRLARMVKQFKVATPEASSRNEPPAASAELRPSSSRPQTR